MKQVSSKQLSVYRSYKKCTDDSHQAARAYRGVVRNYANAEGTQPACYTLFMAMKIIL